MAGLPARAQSADWSELFSQQVERASFTAADPCAGDPTLSVGEFGPVRIVRLNCGRGTIERTPHHVAQSPGRVFTFILQARGGGVFSQYGHEAALGPGDFTLCHGEAPYSYHLVEDCEAVMLRIPAGLLREHLPSPQAFCGRHLPASQGLARSAAMLIASLCSPQRVELSCEAQHRIARHLLDVIATSYAIALDSKLAASSSLGAWQARAKLHIEQHLRSPDLTPSSIARALRLSPRYLRMIFATGNETVSAYILRRRLEQCARQIEDPDWSGHSITEIAFSWGFNSAPHFTRSFRDRYGTSPRALRSRRRPIPSAPASLLPPQEWPPRGRARPASGEPS